MDVKDNDVSITIDKQVEKLSKMQLELIQTDILATARPTVVGII